MLNFWKNFIFIFIFDFWFLYFLFFIFYLLNWLNVSLERVIRFIWMFWWWTFWRATSRTSFFTEFMCNSTCRRMLFGCCEGMLLNSVDNVTDLDAPWCLLFKKKLFEFSFDYFRFWFFPKKALCIPFFFSSFNFINDIFSE